MATSLTYSDFATNLPQLADSNFQTEIETFLNQAELGVNRSEFGTGVPSASTVSKADLAVIYLAGHLFVLFLRENDADGHASPGQVQSFNDGRIARSFATIGTSAGEKALAATTPGAMFLQLRSSVASSSLPLVT